MYTFLAPEPLHFKKFRIPGPESTHFVCMGRASVDDQGQTRENLHRIARAAVGGQVLAGDPGVFAGQRLGAGALAGLDGLDDGAVLRLGGEERLTLGGAGGVAEDEGRGPE